MAGTNSSTNETKLQQKGGPNRPYDCNKKDDLSLGRNITQQRGGPIFFFFLVKQVKEEI